MLRELINIDLRNNIIDKSDVAILFSGGMDSLSLLLSCLDLDIKPVLYTFYLKSYESQDLIYSRKIAKRYDLKLEEIIIEDEDIENLKKDVEYIINHFNVYLKTQVQCIYPFLYVIPRIKEKYVLTGLCADDIYGTCRSLAKISNDKDNFNKSRLERVKNIHSSSYTEIKSICKENNKTLIAPYKENLEIINLFMNLDYKQMNSPKQKNLMYKDYKEELESLKIYRRNSNLQCNSKIREFHDKLLDTNLNSKNYKVVSAIYKNIYKEMENKKYENTIRYD